MYYKILDGKHGGSGSFLCPPGHPALTHSIYGWGSKSASTRTGPDGASYIGSIDSALEAETDPLMRDDNLAVLAPLVRQLHTDADLVCSEGYLRHTYGYFRNCYSLDGQDRNASRAVIPPALPADATDEQKAERARMYPPERHLAYLTVKQYFPEHQPRLDLIEDASGGYGTHACPRCGETVQYEARFDGFCKVTTMPSWRYEPLCQDGQPHG